MRFLAPIAYRVIDSLEAVDRVLRNLDARVREIVNVPILRGKHLTGIVVTSAGTTIQHGLGRQPSGAFITKFGSSTVRSFAFYDFTRTTITAKVNTGSQTISLWIY